MRPTTDLALDTTEQLEEELDGVKIEKENFEDAVVTTIEIVSETGVKTIGKPKGRYITVEITPFISDGEVFDGRMDAVVKTLTSLMPEQGLVLVAGLGNDHITPDALGPKSIDYILATRHISKELGESIGLGGLRGVATIVPGVLGQTGMETGEIICGIAEAVKPACLIVIDALASSSLSRLGCTVQISDTGIIPGSGVGNHRFEINQKTMGIPVISMGIPTVVNTMTLLNEITNGQCPQDETYQNMVVTPREIDTVIERGAKLIGMSINRCLQKNLSVQDIFSLVG